MTATIPPPQRRRRRGNTVQWCLQEARRAYRWQDALRYRVRHRLGYRGLILFMFGLIYVFIGLAIIGSNDYRPELVHTHLPLWFRLSLWIIPGVVSAALSMDHKWQAIGFALLFIPPAERAVSYAIAAVTVPTWQRVPAVLVYCLILLTVTFVAAWPEPTEMQKDITRQDEGSLNPHSDDHKWLGRDGLLRNGQGKPVDRTAEDLLKEHKSRGGAGD